MTYILIGVFVFYQKAASVVAEFNSREACLEAANAIRSQYRGESNQPVLVCAAKGAKP